MQSSMSDCVNRQDTVNTRTEAKFANVWKVNKSCHHLAMGFPAKNWGKLQMFWSQGQIVQSWENKRTNPGDCWAWQPKSEFEIKERPIWELQLWIPFFSFIPRICVMFSTWKDPLHLSGVVDDPVPWLNDALEHLGLPCLLLAPRLNVTSLDASNHPQITILLPQSKEAADTLHSRRERV